MIIIIIKKKNLEYGHEDYKIEYPRLWGSYYYYYYFLSSFWGGVVYCVTLLSYYTRYESVFFMYRRYTCAQVSALYNWYTPKVIILRFCTNRNNRGVDPIVATTDVLIVLRGGGRQNNKRPKWSKVKKGKKNTIVK